MLASQHFNLTGSEADDWFDTILDADTELFVDPFLLFKDKEPTWRQAHAEIIGHFDNVFQLIAEGNRIPSSPAYKKAIDLLVFTEPKEFCLGYTSKGTSGAGSGLSFAKLIAQAIAEAIGRGLKHPKHFEELGILNRGIGADRISDATCTILKQKLIQYTQAISVRHSIPLFPHQTYAADYDKDRKRWMTLQTMLPTNPFTHGALIFVPKRFLRELPSINAEEWWNSWENEQLRTDINYEIMGKVDKDTIVRAARENPDAVRRWTEQFEHKEPNPYDLSRDRSGVWQWDRATQKHTVRNPLLFTTPSDEPAFRAIIEAIIGQFRLFVEEQGGWSLLWNEYAGTFTEKPEKSVQLLFRGIAQHYCRANNIVLDPEVNLGRGPVDFKFSSGQQFQAHLEIKKRCKTESFGAVWKNSYQVI